MGALYWLIQIMQVACYHYINAEATEKQHLQQWVVQESSFWNEARTT